MLSTASPFDPATGELLPACRDSYLRGDLSIGPAQEVEEYLKKNPVQARLALARWHQLAAQVKTSQQPPLASPPWVLSQLALQPSVSALGPLRRPIVQAVLLVALVLAAASVVQWIRHKPIVPAPVVASFQRVARSVTQATRSLAGLEPLKEEPKPIVRPKAKVVAQASKPAPPAKRLTLPEPAEPLSTRPVITSLTPEPAPAVVAPTAAIEPAEPGNIVVQGRITDDRGRALPGATVLVPGTRLATSTNASGAYRLEVPLGATLSFGYAGYADQLVRGMQSEINVTLAPLQAELSRR